MISNDEHRSQAQRLGRVGFWHFRSFCAKDRNLIEIFVKKTEKNI